MILAADVGGTKTLLALCEAGERSRIVVRFERRYENDAHGGFTPLLEQFLAESARALGGAPAIAAAGFAVAGPVAGGRARLTNREWEIDGARLAARLGVPRAVVVNDFAATALGIEALAAEEFVTLQAGEPVARAPRVVVGAGTGFGVAHLFWDGTRYREVPGEGGHAGFAPADREQAALWDSIFAEKGRVEVEDVVSGPGLERIRAFVAEGGPPAGHLLRAPEVAAGALAGTDYASVRALDLFIAAYGAVAGDLALGVLARGGVFVAGGIAARILPRLRAPGFLEAFNAKGRFAPVARRMPVHVVASERVALFGAAIAAHRHPSSGE
ncbi:MAG: glucokinase [Burkholderiales bacterium]|nr:glucokinase [Burkholderiales bacterium]